MNGGQRQAFAQYCVRRPYRRHRITAVTPVTTATITAFRSAAEGFKYCQRFPAEEYSVPTCNLSLGYVVPVSGHDSFGIALN